MGLFPPNRYDTPWVLIIMEEGVFVPDPPSRPLSSGEVLLIQHELKNSTMYSYGKCRHQELNGFAEITYSNAAVYLASESQDASVRAVGLWALARCVQDNQRILLPDGRVMTEDELNLASIESNPLFSCPYNNLAVMLPPGTTVTLSDGRTFNERQLYVEALRLDPDYPTAYNNLGADLLLPGESITLADGRVLVQRDLYLQALGCDPNYVTAYVNLADTMGVGELVSLADGRVLSSTACLVEALRLDPTDPTAYNSLATKYV